MSVSQPQSPSQPASQPESRPKDMFDFGKNWAEFSAQIDDVRCLKSKEGLAQLLADYIALADKSFLDIGCGSGLHALAALELGAAHVMAVDIDVNSVNTCRAVLDQRWSGDNYDVEAVNILTDTDFAKKPFEVVYSWGVLHHTGDMWQAIKSAALFVADDGHFVIAIYKKTPLCGFWAFEKKLYSALPKILRLPLDWVYGAGQILALLATGKNPASYIREYREKRGMHWMTDIKDWLGGHPYESASPEEIKSGVERLGFKMVKSVNIEPARGFGVLGTGCAEYVFKKI